VRAQTLGAPISSVSSIKNFSRCFWNHAMWKAVFDLHLLFVFVATATLCTKPYCWTKWKWN